MTDDNPPPRAADIYIMPGVERRDLTGPEVPSAMVLQSSIDEGITDVVVVGLHRDGTLYVACACPDMDRVVGFLMRAVFDLARPVGNDNVIDGADGPDDAA